MSPESGKSGKDKKLKYKTVAVRNWWKRNQVLSTRRVLIDDAQELPSTLPDGTPLLTKEELMRLNFEKAGCPKKGAKDD